MRRGDAVFGVAQTLPSPWLTDVALSVGFDFVMIDCEHGVVDEAAQIACFQVIEHSAAFSAVRVRPGDFASVGRYLDFGADAVLLADVRSVSEAKDFVAAATPGPRGTRSSTGSARSTRYGLAPAKEPLLLAMIEGAAAVDSIEEIATTEGLHGLVIGPNDLSADLECFNEFDAPLYRKSFEAIEQAARSAGLFLGTRPHGDFGIARLLAAGHRFILSSSDIGALREGYRADLSRARPQAPGTAR